MNSKGKKRATKIDFSRLSWGTLRKYQYFYRLPTDAADKDAVAEAARSHFENELKVDNVALVAKILRIKKDDKQDPLYNLRKPARPRGAGAAHLMNDGLF